MEPARGGDPLVRRRRLLGVDATRGIALLGMMAVHVLPDEDADGSRSTAYAIASGRAAAAFAVLAGVGLALSTGGARRPRFRRSASPDSPDPPLSQPLAQPAAGLVVRALVIGAVGMLLGYPDSGVAVILPYYALLFVVAVPLLPAHPRVLAATAGVAAVVVPAVSLVVRRELPEPNPDNPTFADLEGLHEIGGLAVKLLLTGDYPVLAWVTYLAAGLAVGRLSLRSPRVAIALLGGGAGLAVVAVLLSALLLGPLGGRDHLASSVGGSPSEVEAALSSEKSGTTPTDSWWWLAIDAPHSSTPLDLAHTTGTALALLGALLLLARVASPLLAPLADAGSMTFTLYSAHVLVLSVVTDLLWPMDSYLLQVGAALFLATLWRGGGRSGPLEAATSALSRRAHRAAGSLLVRRRVRERVTEGGGAGGRA